MKHPRNGRLSRQKSLPEHLHASKIVGFDECQACKVFLKYLLKKEKCVSVITFGEGQFCVKENL